MGHGGTDGVFIGKRLCLSGSLIKCSGRDLLWDGWLGVWAVLTRWSGDDVSREALHRPHRHG